MGFKSTYDGSKKTLTLVFDNVDIAKAPISGGGKSRLIATTGGNKPINLDGKEAMAGVNIYLPLEASDWDMEKVNAKALEKKAAAAKLLKTV
jgi:hypothetical protein